MFFPLASVVMVQVLVNFCGSTVHGFSSVAFGHRPHRGRTTALQYTESVIPPVPPVDVSGGVVTVRPTTRRRTSRDRFIEKNYNNNDVAASKSRRPTKRTGLTTASTTIVKSMQDFQKTVLQEQESMVIVRFMASWCPVSLAKKEREQEKKRPVRMEEFAKMGLKLTPISFLSF